MTLWSGRFRKPLHPLLLQFSRCVDTRLADVDLRGSLAHIAALKSAGLISESEHAQLASGLQSLRDRLATEGELPFSQADEDVHMGVERLLGEAIGPVAGKLHTGRSRNDQVATDMHLFVKEEAAQCARLFVDLAEVCARVAAASAGKTIPGLTHLQWAQPVLLQHHLLAYAWMFLRDSERLLVVTDHADCSPLGAGALAGAGLPLDPSVSQNALGFARLYDNSMDAVSDRDYILEFIAALTLAQVHLSRLSEEIVLWTNPQIAIAVIDDEFATGSSMMPQKKNPDAAELIRGKTGPVLGSFVALASMLKGLPLTYNRDLQEDKPILFGALDTVRACAEVAAELVPRLTFHDVPMRDGDALFATDLADHLVELGIPFREAHAISGRLVAEAEERQVSLLDVPEDVRIAIHPLLQSLPRLTLEESLRRRASHLGTAPEAVAEQAQRATAETARLREAVNRYS